MSGLHAAKKWGVRKMLRKVSRIMGAAMLFVNRLHLHDYPDAKKIERHKYYLHEKIPQSYTTMEDNAAFNALAHSALRRLEHVRCSGVGDDDLATLSDIEQILSVTLDCFWQSYSTVIGSVTELCARLDTHQVDCKECELHRAKCHKMLVRSADQRQSENVRAVFVQKTSVYAKNVRRLRWAKKVWPEIYLPVRIKIREIISVAKKLIHWREGRKMLKTIATMSSICEYYDNEPDDILYALDIASAYVRRIDAADDIVMEVLHAIHGLYYWWRYDGGSSYTNHHFIADISWPIEKILTFHMRYAADFVSNVAEPAD